MTTRRALHGGGVEGRMMPKHGSRRPSKVTEGGSSVLTSVSCPAQFPSRLPWSYDPVLPTAHF